MSVSRQLAAVMLVAVAYALVWAAIAPTQASAQNRSLTLYNTHTHERLTVTYKRNGRFVQGGLDQLNRFLRDWRRDEVTRIDPDLFDIVWNVYRDVGATQPIHVVSAYRSPATNAMLRRRSSGVARNSQHTQGRAMDFFIPGVSASALRAAGLRQQQGGVGYYPRSNTPFVHLDTGTVRMWPRMTRSQLARVFPNGRTIHIPSDGRPMAGFDQAQRELQRGGRRSTIQVASSGASVSASQEDPSAVVLPGNAGAGEGNILSGLFSGGNDAPTTEAPATQRRPAPTEVAAAPQPERRGPYSAPAPILPPNALDSDATSTGPETAVAAADAPPPPVPAPTLDDIQIAAATQAQPASVEPALEIASVPPAATTRPNRPGAIDATFAAAQGAQTSLPADVALPPINRAQQIAQTVPAPGQIAALIEARFAEQRAQDASLRGQVASALQAGSLTSEQTGIPSAATINPAPAPIVLGSEPRFVPPAPTPVQLTAPTAAPVALASASAPPETPATPSALVASAFAAQEVAQQDAQAAISTLARSGSGETPSTRVVPGITPSVDVAAAPDTSSTDAAPIITGSAPAQVVGALHALSEPAAASLAKNSIRGRAHARLVPPSDVLNLTPVVLQSTGFSQNRPFMLRSDRFNPRGLTSTFDGG